MPALCGFLRIQGSLLGLSVRIWWVLFPLSKASLGTEPKVGLERLRFLALLRVKQTMPMVKYGRDYR